MAYSKEEIETMFDKILHSVSQKGDYTSYSFNCSVDYMTENPIRVYKGFPVYYFIPMEKETAYFSLSMMATDYENINS